MKVDLAEDRPTVAVSLKDGRAAVLSPILAEDREFLRAGVEELSIETRYARFGQGRAHLSESELDYLTVVDQRRHVAWGAVVDGQTAGVARFIALNNTDAEVAVTVADRFRQLGLGRALFRALVAVARSDGLETFVFQALSDNTVVRRLLSGLPVVASEMDGTIDGRIALSDLPVAEDDHRIVAVMEAVRVGLVG